MEVDFGDNRSAIGVAEQRMGMELRKALYSNLYMSSGMTSRASWCREYARGGLHAASLVPVCRT